MRLGDLDQLMDQVVRKKADWNNRKYMEGFNDCILRVRSMIHSAKTIDPESLPIVQELRKERDQLREIIGWDHDLNHLQKLVEADRDGRNFVSAVKIGDHVFDVGEGTIDEWEVTGISVGDACLELYGNEIVEYDDEVIVTAKGVTVYGKMQFPVSSIDEDVYRTQEAAEAALAKEEEQCNVK